MATGRHEDPDEHSTGSRGGRVLFVGAVVMALGATGVLVLSDDLRWLRLGIVAALWAALVGAFLTAKYRRQVADRQADAADLQSVYELELEREVAARREYELEVESQTRRRVEAESSEDIAALRNELRSLRQTLETLVGGEVLVERFALHAESTRMRSLPEESRPLVRRQGPVKRLTAGPAKPDGAPAPDADLATERFERVRDAEVRPVQPRVERRVETAPRRPDRPANRPEWPTRQSTRPVEEVHRPHPAEVSDRWFMPGALQPENSGVAESRARPPARAQTPPSELVERIDPNWTPSWESGGGAGPARPDPTGWPGADPMATGRRHAQPQPDVGRRGAEPAPTGRRHAQPEREVSTSRRHAQPEREVSTGRRHARPDDAADTGGGRRRRAEGTPSWQEQAAWRSAPAEPQAPVHNGSHARNSEVFEDPAGSHAEGMSVNELLAAHGGAPNPRRRRRRRDG